MKYLAKINKFHNASLLKMIMYKKYTVLGSKFLLINRDGWYKQTRDPKYHWIMTRYIGNKRLYYKIKI